MTTMYPEKVKCAVCNKVSEFYVLGSTNAFGSMDLDTRPPEMQRSTMAHWLQACPHCHYVAGSIADKPSAMVTQELLQKYAQESTCLEAELARDFYIKYKLEILAEDNEAAFFSILHAAWACDDQVQYKKGRAADAIFCRELALNTLETVMEQASEDMKLNLTVLKADLLRRVGKFAELLKLYDESRFAEGLLQTIIAFQRHLAKQQDSGCYTVEAALAWQEKA